MLKKLAVGLAVVVLALAAFVASRPSTYRVERSTTIAAPAEVVFGYVSDFRRWAGWSPWEKLDPAMKKNYEGSAAGVGASYHWVGNDQVGEGRMTITESRPSEHLAIKLEFIKPWASTNTTEFAIKPAGDHVTLSWAMSGNHDFMGKAFSLFMDMDAMIGTDFEQGLAAIKSHAEADAAKAAEAAKAEAEAQEAAATPSLDAGVATP